MWTPIYTCKIVYPHDRVVENSSEHCIRQSAACFSCFRRRSASRLLACLHAHCPPLSKDTRSRETLRGVNTTLNAIWYHLLPSSIFGWVLILWHPRDNTSIREGKPRDFHHDHTLFLFTRVFVFWGRRTWQMPISACSARSLMLRSILPQIEG